jgi:hypothetical protein
MEGLEPLALILEAAGAWGVTLEVFLGAEVLREVGISS